MREASAALDAPRRLVDVRGTPTARRPPGHTPASGLLLTPLASPTARILPLWHRLSPLPGGTRLFSMLLGRLVPYTGSVRPHVVALAPGHARVRMADRRAVRNHLRSVHAIALANLAEAASGLAVISALPPEGRGILTGFRIEYLKKARGPLEAECRCEVPPIGDDVDFEPLVEIRDRAGQVVVRAWPVWRIGRIPAGRGAGTA